MLISGCAADKTPSEPLPSQFESDFSANVGKLEIGGHIVRNETGIYTLTLTAPKTLEGMTINYVGNKVSTDINGVIIETPSVLFPANDFAKSVANALDTLCKTNSVSVTRTDGFIKYEASSASSTFYVLTEQDTNNIVSLVIKSADISMNFTNFKHN